MHRTLLRTVLVNQFDTGDQKLPVFEIILKITVKKWIKDCNIILTVILHMSRFMEQALPT